jgi:hypothetical protein
MEQSPPSEAVIQLVRKFQAFSGTLMFIVTFTRVHLTSSYLGFSVKNMNIKYCFQENTYKNISNNVHDDKVTPHFSDD